MILRPIHYVIVAVLIVAFCLLVTTSPADSVAESCVRIEGAP